MREVEREVRINSLLQDLSLVSLANYDKVQATRKMVLGLAADVREEVKYGGIFSLPKMLSAACLPIAVISLLSLGTAQNCRIIFGAGRQGKIQAAYQVLYDKRS
ncbi:MAG: hypothetical protein ACEQSE_10005 [Candidatus Aquirickettsiella gammari]